MGWYCVFIENTRIAKAISVTFRNMLMGVYQDKGQPVDCHVYYWKSGGGHYYYFSPAAAKVLVAFIKFWEGYEVSEPTNLQRMEIVISPAKAYSPNASRLFAQRRVDLPERIVAGVRRSDANSLA